MPTTNITKIKTKRNNLFLRVAQGHFATSHSHSNYYIDVAAQKSRLSEAKAVAKELCSAHNYNTTIVDTILCLDGTEVIANSQVPTTMYAFGNFDNIVFAQFGDIEVVVDEYTQAINGCVRLVINAYFDWKKVRADQDVLVYGTVSRPAANNG